MERLYKEAGVISYSEPRILGRTDRPKWVGPILKLIELDPYAFYYAGGKNDENGRVLRFRGSDYMNKLGLENSDIAEFLLEEENKQWRTYVEHHRVTSKKYFDLEASKGALFGTYATIGGGAVAANLATFAITPGLGILTASLTGAVAATAAVTGLVWHKRNKNQAYVTLTKDGERLRKEIEAYERYIESQESRKEPKSAFYLAAGGKYIEKILK